MPTTTWGTAWRAAWASGDTCCSSRCARGPCACAGKRSPQLSHPVCHRATHAAPRSTAALAMEVVSETSGRPRDYTRDEVANRIQQIFDEYSVEDESNVRAPRMMTLK